MNLRFRWWMSVAIFALLFSAACVSSSDGESDGCTVATNDGVKMLECPDGTSVVIEDGTSCTVQDNQDGTHTISCEDGTEAVISDGGGSADSCTVVDNENGTATVTCPDGTEQTFDISGEDSNDVNGGDADAAEIEILSFDVTVDGDVVTFDVEFRNNGPADIVFDEGEDSGGVFVDFFRDESQAPSLGDFGDVEGWVDVLDAGATTVVTEEVSGVNSGTFDAWVSIAGHNEPKIAGDIAGPVSYTVD